MTLIWDEKAEESLLQISDYIYLNFGEQSETKFQQEVLHTTNQLLNNPNMCALDPLLAGRSHAYRSTIINRHSKMVYYVDETSETIRIAAFWDCRREPLAQTVHLN